MKLRLFKRGKVPDIRKILSKVAPLTTKQRQVLYELEDSDVPGFIAGHFGITDEMVLKKVAFAEDLQFLSTLPTPFLRALIGHPPLKELRKHCIVPIVMDVGRQLVIGCNPTQIYKQYPLIDREEIALSTSQEIYRVVNQLEAAITSASIPEKETLTAITTMREEAARFSTDKIVINIYADSLEYALTSIHGEVAVGVITPELRANLIDLLAVCALTGMPITLIDGVASVQAKSTTEFEVIFQCLLQQAVSQ